MNSIRKKIMASLLAGTFLLSVSAEIPLAEAADSGNAPQAEAQKLSKADLDAIAKDIAEQYGVDQAEVREALAKGKLFDDIYYAAMLAKVSGKSFKTVFAMKQDWFDVMQKLNITADRWRDVMKDMVVEDIALRSSLGKETVRKLMDEHYHPRDIRIAGRLADASKKDVHEVLGMKTINKRWIDVANELKVDPGIIRPRSPQEEEEDAEMPEGQQ